MKESLPKQERPISPEEFFANNVDIRKLSKEEFFSEMKKKFPDMPDDEITQRKASNWKEDGKFFILMRTDVFPSEYMPYMETHEKWEAYMSSKGGI